MIIKYSLGIDIASKTMQWQFRVTRKHGTERAGSGEYCESHQPGLYVASSVVIQITIIKNKGRANPHRLALLTSSWNR